MRAVGRAKAGPEAAGGLEFATIDFKHRNATRLLVLLRDAEGVDGGGVVLDSRAHGLVRIGHC